jgi:hypothetical protein
MTSARASLLAAAIFVGALAVQVLVDVVETFISLIGAAYVGPVGELFEGLGFGVLQQLLRAIVLGVGIFVAFRFVTPVHGEDSWRRVFRTAALATLFGTAVFVIIGVVVTLIQSTNPGEYPFGYAFTPSFNSGLAIYGVVRVAAVALGNLVEWFAFVLVVTGIQKIWFARPLSTKPVLIDNSTKGRASVSG